MTQEKQSGRVLHVFDNIVSTPTETSQHLVDGLPSEIPSRRWMYWQMTLAVTKKVAHAPFSIHTWGALRRTVLSNVLPDNILYRYKAYQRGECNRCGLCCKIQFQCPFFVDEGPNNTRCSIYTTPYAPQAITCATAENLAPMHLRPIGRSKRQARWSSMIPIRISRWRKP